MTARDDGSDGAAFAVDRPDGAVVLRVSGEIDMATSAGLKRHLVEIAREEPPVVVLDLTSVDFFDSSGLNAVVAGHRLMRHHGGEVRIVCSEPRVTRVFEISGLTHVFTLHDSVDDAIAPG